MPWRRCILTVQAAALLWLMNRNYRPKVKVTDKRLALEVTIWKPVFPVRGWYASIWIWDTSLVCLLSAVRSVSQVPKNAGLSPWHFRSDQASRDTRYGYANSSNVQHVLVTWSRRCVRSMVHAARLFACGLRKRRPEHLSRKRPFRGLQWRSYGQQTIARSVCYAPAHSVYSDCLSSRLLAWLDVSPNFPLLLCVARVRVNFESNGWL